MNTRKVLLFIACILLSGPFSFAQIVSVNPLTGGASAYIPIYTVSQGQVSVPVGLTYSGTGVKPKDVEGSAGMGWNIQAGGAVTREVRGLPDDVTKDNAGKSLYGWMSPLDTGASKVAGWTITNDGINCAKMTADVNYITANFPYRDDTEPDMFYVNAPGLSCQLVYNRADTTFHPVSYQDLKITYTVVGGTGSNKSNIASFTITNDKGVQYVFSSPETITQKASVKSGYPPPSYYYTKFQQYQNGITYYDSWNLYSITDPNGNGVILGYNTEPQTMGADSVGMFSGVPYSYQLQYKMLNIITSQRIANISTVNVNYALYNQLRFYWMSSDGSTGQTVIDSIGVPGNTINFSYSNVAYTPKNYSRDFLRSMYITGCGSPVNYQFKYIGETPNFPGSNFYTSTLPDSSSLQRDYWGYYSALIANPTSLMPKVWISGYHSNIIPPYAIYETNTGSDVYPYYTSNTNANMWAADTVNVMVGSLNKIILPQGGSTNIIYESNDYVDVPSGAVVKGGGIRVRQLIDSASRGTTSTIIHNYSYKDPTTGLTSGKPVTLPEFSFTVPYGGAATGNTLWNDCTALSAYDLSPEDHTIMYQYAKVSQTGVGYTQYQYYIPATNWDSIAGPACSGCSTTEWAPTFEYVSNCSGVNGPITNHTNNYPFIPNANYDFERGLPLKISSYNNDPTPKEVSETDYTYQRSYTPATISALRWEDANLSGLVSRCYGKYNVFYNTSELTGTVTTKIFDSSGSGSYRTSTATYTYGSSNHKLLTQETVTNSDNSVLTTNIKYIKDYSPNSSTNANINALYQLKQMNINAPVESWNQVTRGGTTVTTSASLTLFNKYLVNSFTHYLPSQQWKLLKADGEVFTPFSINTAAPSISIDTGYVQAANYDTYDDTGFPQTVDDAHKHFQTNILDHYSGQISASVKNAAYKEFAFADFDSDYGYGAYIPDYYFSFSGTKDTTTAITGSHTGYAAKLGIGQTLSHTITKNTSATKYILSMWIEAPTGTNTIYVSLNGGTPIACTYTGLGMTKWKYCEWNNLPMAGLPSTFTVAITTSHTIGIDDVIFYPDVAEASTAAYDKVGHYKIAATNTNGISTYFTNDQWGRPLYVLNQDKHIVQKNTYVTGEDLADFTPVIGMSSSIYVNVSTAFSINNVPTCSAAGVTVTWNFGDGSAPVNTALTTSPTHTYTSINTFTITAVVHSPLYGDKTVTSPVVVLPGNITLSYTNTQPGGNGNLMSLVFSQGGNTQYTFANYQINGAIIKQGIYDVTATVTNSLLITTYSFSLTGDGGNGYFACTNYTANANLTFHYTADLTACSTLSVWMSNTHCGTPP